jgi:hypothetical protein
MAGLEDVVQKVLLQGDGEMLSALNEIGRTGAEAFKQLEEASKSGASGMESIGIVASAIVTSIAAVTGAMIAFVEASDDATQKTAFLAEAFGSTTAELVGIEAAFASAGISASNFERFAQRLTITISREWPQITASIRTAATQQSEAQEQIVAASIRVKEAQNAVAFGAESDAQKISAANLRVRETYRALEFAAAEAASLMQHDNEAVAGSATSVEAALQHLHTVQGNPPTDAEKQSLALNQAQEAVDNARTAHLDAINKRIKDQAEAADKLAQKKQAADDAELSRAKDIAQMETARLQRQNALNEAIDRADSAREKATQRDLTDITKISTALQGVIDKNADVAKSIDLGEVSTRNITKSVIAMAAAANNVKVPTGIQAFTELQKVFQNSTKDTISEAQRLEIVQELISRGFQSGGAAAAEMARALSRTGDQFKDLTEAASKHISTQKAGTDAAEHLKIAFENLNIDLDLTRRDLAALASPALVSFFETLQSSLDNTGGLLHAFVTGLEAIGTGVKLVVGFFEQLGNTIDRAFSLGPGTGMQVLLIALTVIVGLFLGVWVAIPATIVLVITAMGGLSEITTKVKNYVVDLWEKFKASPAGQIIEGITDRVKELLGWLSKLPKWLGGNGGAAAPAGPSVGRGGNAGEGGTAGDLSGGTTALAGGGQVDGPGTTTSDSIMARLSRGEFVVKAAAVQAYGASLFHALNNMQLPGFASGGLVPSPVRMGSGSVPATSTLNLSIDGRSFNGLRGPKSTIDDLSSFAIARQASAAGNNPSWMK